MSSKQAQGKQEVKRKQPQTKSRNWCWTLNNYSEDEIKHIAAYATLNPKMYIIYGKEVGDGTSDVPLGTPHLQGFSHYPSCQAHTALHKMAPRCSPSIMYEKSNPVSCITYCSKGGDVTTFGTAPVTQQEVNKALQRRFIDLAHEGKFDMILEEQPGKYVQQYNTMHKMAVDKITKPPSLTTKCGVWIYGETGCGKTWAARNNYGTYYSKMCNKWWDGFQNEDCVIVEDMDPSHSKMAHHIKIWMDEWSFLGEVKGSACQIRPKKVIVTSQYTIAEVFHDQGERAIEAITRRCEVIHMHKRLATADAPFSPPKKRAKLSGSHYLDPREEGEGESESIHSRWKEDNLDIQN